MKGLAALFFVLVLGVEIVSAEGSKVLVSGKGFSITEDDLKLIAESMPEGAKRKLWSDKFSMINYLKFLAEIEVFSRLAKEEGIDKDPVIRKQIELETKRILAKAYLDRELKKRLSEVNFSEEDLKSYYEANREEFRTANGTYKSFCEVKLKIREKLLNELKASVIREIEEKAFSKFKVKFWR